jgi:valyl-tRNA synthetase
MELPSVYSPEETEAKWYPLWEERGLFGSRPGSDRPPFTIVIPPPNVTGSLHMGHALNNTLQDVLARWRRMKGDNALWIPGTDHGGIATQNVVEKILKKEGKNRHALGREAFLERMWAWRKESGDTILHQLRKLGCSLDWSRTRFTMDEASSRAVAAAFVEFFSRNLIYQGVRLVNWCPRCCTALSDIEVEHEDRTGSLWHIRYPFVNDKAGGVIVATTRPETMLGDTGVAVNPTDERYQGLAGKKLLLPLMNREIPLVADAAVDASFGTGAVKVTPSHDATDFEIGERHNLPHEMVIGFDGKMTARAGRFAGLSVKECREKVVAELEAQNLLVKVEDHRHAVSTCYRCNTTIEPLESSQWFLKTSAMAEAAANATEDGRVKIHPESWTKPYLAWLHNNRDWCISRQIWWGHQIPVWYCLACGDYSEEKVRRIREDPTFKNESAKSLLRESAKRPIVQAEPPATCPDCGSKDVVRDPDVLDTWFSSGLWPLTTLGWPEETDALQVHYPTSVLATGHEILYLWVARMVMMGLALRNDVPYRDVFIHGIVRDKQGRKMSKSLNNVIDPLDIMKKYGTDALRYALVAQASPGRDMQMADDTFIGARNFSNKLWNACRFVLMNLNEYKPSTIPLSQRTPADRWMAQRFSDTMTRVDGHLQALDPSQAARALYDFFWSDFCDWYIELAKPRLQPGVEESSARAAQQTLTEILDGVLRALHPVMPFITEELWQALWTNLGAKPTGSLMEGPYECPWQGPIASPEDLRGLALVQETVTAIRTIRSEMNVPPGKGITVIVNLTGASEATKGHLAQLASHITHLAKIADWKVIETGECPPPPQAASAVAADFEMFIPLQGLIDFAKERLRLEKGKADGEGAIKRDEERLNNPDFRSRAPADKVAEVEARLAESKTQLARIETFLRTLGE